MRSFFERIRRWLFQITTTSKRFDEVLREACEEPMVLVSAKALTHSISPPPACGIVSNGGDGRPQEVSRA